jgi:methylmalonyl-CoA/ethylmalonyl-CoA epimerase
MVNKIKHMAVAVEDVDAAVARYQELLDIGEPKLGEWKEGRSKEAHFFFGEVQIQLCQSTDPEGRFAQHIARSGEGVQHICLEVDDIDQAIEHALASGAVLKPCQAHGTVGSHAHTEGWIAFLEGQAVPGFEIEYMQVYKDGERPEEIASSL